MSQKREFDEGKARSSPEDKRRRFKSVVQEVMRLQTVKHFLEPVLEPLIRKVVKEEVELALGKHLPGLKWICEKEVHPLESKNLELKFLNNLSLPVFTSARIEGDECQAIRIGLIDPLTSQIVSNGPVSSAKLEVFVVEGDFESDNSYWRDEDMRNNIVREREGKKPLLNGNVYVVLSNGIGVMDEISFTDNSSWTRSRRFKLGVRMVDRFEFVKVRDATTESFVVRDHRGELYRKHHPPALFDEVWRLEKIGKDGAFHKRLNLSNINTVKDFLTQCHLNPSKLKQILGTGMSSKMWDITLDHAKSCVLDTNVHLYYPPQLNKKTAVVFNVVARVLGLLIDCQYIRAEKLSEIEKTQAEELVVSALNHLDEVISFDDENSMIESVCTSTGIEYSGVSMSTFEGYNVPNQEAVRFGGEFNDEMEELNLWYMNTSPVHCSQILGLDEPESDLQSALDGFIEMRNVAGVDDKAAHRRWTKLFSVSKWLTVFKNVTVRKGKPDVNRT